MTQFQRRFLFVVPPLAGHVNPTAGLGRTLMSRGHEVAWAGSELFLRPLLGQGADIHPTGSKMLRDQGAGGIAAVRSLWEQFVVPYARFTLKAVGRAIEAFKPDLVITDEHTPAGALAAQLRAVPWATLATSSMEIGRPFRDQPQIEDWVTGHLRGLWASAGLDPSEFVDPRSSTLLVLALTCPALVDVDSLPARCALVGPILGGRPDAPPFPREALDLGRRHVLVTMGTLAADLSAGFHQCATEALGGLDDRVQGILVAPAHTVPKLPDNVLTFDRVPMLELLGTGAIDAVVCHGGLNTVTEALAHRVPLVLAPIRHDQPITAARVEAAGAGVRVSFEDATPEILRGAIETVLDDAAFRAAAGRIADQFAVLGGASAAADLLESVAKRVSAS